MSHVEAHSLAPIFLPFDADLRKVLEIEPPFFLAGRSAPFRQLDYIGRYLESLEASAVVVEPRYIDRDFIEDHSLFYSRSLSNYDNFCRRLHFFKGIEADAIRAKLEELTAHFDSANGSPSDTLGEYRSLCYTFSRRHYLGFSVVKPLPGSPVGRTALRSFAGEQPGEGRVFPSTREYKTHLFGVELSVSGLAFQQQDEGVSACATTALWMSLQKFRDMEEIAAATPAQITNFAVRNVLPYGRALPQEGLSTDQMCQAIQALGGAPLMLRPPTIAYARHLLFSATSSGMAPILIMQKGNEAHAVTVVGTRSKKDAEAPGIQGSYRELAGGLEAIYIHDDRIGPYLRATLEEGTGANSRKPMIRIVEGGTDESWLLTHLIVPMHPKIRISCDKIADMALSLGAELRALAGDAGTKIPKLWLQTSILRASAYIEQLVVPSSSQARVTGTTLVDLLSETSLSRYVGLARFHAPELGSDSGGIDVLIDTTGTVRNGKCSAIVSRYSSPTKLTSDVVKLLGESVGCQWAA